MWKGDERTCFPVDAHPDTFLFKSIVKIDREKFGSKNCVRSDIPKRRFRAHRVIMRVAFAILRITNGDGWMERGFSGVVDF